MGVSSFRIHPRTDMIGAKPSQEEKL